MPASLQSRTQYLSLAEFCQEVIEGLMDFWDGAAGANPRLKQRLGEGLESFKAISSGRLHALASANPAPFITFEQVRTVQEVWGDAQLARAIRLIKGLLAASSSKAHKVKFAEELIDLFSRLQAKALWNFKQPTEVLPRSFGALCRVL